MRKVALLFLVFGFILTSCAQSDKKDQLVKISTAQGEIIAILYDETPKHKSNFIELVRKKYYDSLLFHRVMKEFMIQGGDPDSKKAVKGQHLGNGGPGYTIPAEFIPTLYHERGALCAARLPDGQNPEKASSGSQFYIVQGKVFTKDELTLDPAKLNIAMGKYFENGANRPQYDSLVAFYQRQDGVGYNNYLLKLKPKVIAATGLSVDKDIPVEKLKLYTTVGGAPHLDGAYTIFGKVIKGLEVVDKIAAVTVDGANRPFEDVRMQISIVEMSRKKITKEYGYVYPTQK